MIGEADERTQVHKLWFGLQKEIQHDLWHEKLNPEISSLKDVIAAAEVIEIAQSVTTKTKGKGRTKTPTAIHSAAATPDGGEQTHQRSRHSSQREKSLGDLSDWDGISDAASEISCDNLDLPPIKSCMMDVEDDSTDSLSDSSGSGTTIMGLQNDPHLGCCVSRPGEMGNPLGDRARERLDGIAYPGESMHMPGVLDTGRFCIHPTSSSQHTIYDTLHRYDQDVLIDTCLLRHPRFTIDQWYWHKCAESLDWSMHEIWNAEFLWADFSPPMGTPVEERVVFCLNLGVPVVEDGLGNEHRFQCLYHAGEESYEIRDQHLMLRTYLLVTLAENARFNVSTWYRRRLDHGTHNEDIVDELNDDFVCQLENSTINNSVDLETSDLGSPRGCDVSLHHIELNAIEKARSGHSGYTALRCNAAVTHDFMRTIPHPVVVTVHVDGQPARALIDTGSLANFMSLMLTEQLRVKRLPLEKPSTIQLAVQGSRSKVNFGTKVQFQYQGIDYDRYFDVINLQHYNMILGTPFLYQHQVLVRLNSLRVILGSKMPLVMKGPQVSILESRATDVYEENLGKVRERLMADAKPLCSQAGATALPPFQGINHSIPLIDEGKIYPWRPSHCPEALRPLWIEKKNTSLKSGRWEMTAARNTCPMLLLPKPGSPPHLRVVVDLCERNKNTRKLSSPMPDMDGILRRVARKKIVPEHVSHSAVTTPDGNMALMNYLFSEYIGVFMDVYLDDIIIYSDTLEEHVKHVRIVLDILKHEKLYISEKKLKILCKEVKILGCIVTDDGICMDPDKVTSIVNWKVLTNRTLCKGFIGSVGYLADNIYKVCVPLGVLAEASAKSKPFVWGFTEQRAFETAKAYTAACASSSCVPLHYGPSADPIWVMTDACGNGVGGVVV
ncbi:hypothetical protein SCLCIDRAFT_33007 [Scleroderma citrinum Foug A]|uniref:Reverse transcriptase domain-containing protein n=1 Tax=Scleroderma citrinum Foug A TaxID=1036808 RepID=A0A0C3D7B8_9AGAM|nr:hypothetical protein SCLCIDRAFT_33007 [Scleroderma citrinum Foug A]